MADESGRRAAPTISDVAQLAGVSRAVASRALSTEKRPVSADKRERVVKAAEELGYKPNLLAQSLTTKTVNLVAVVVNHIHDLSDLELFDLLIDEIQTTGKQVILIRVGSVDRVEEFMRKGVAFHVDAALVFSDFADAKTVRKMFRSDHVVMLNGRHDEHSPVVTQDQASGIAQAVADAANKGVHTVALVTGRPSSYVERTRTDLYRAAFAAHGMSLVQEIQGDYSYQSGHDAGAALLDDARLEAVFCTSDAMAMGVLDACRALFPDNVPTRFRLYGFDNISLMNLQTYPIASIGYDNADYVREIVKALVHPENFVAGQKPVLVPTRFVPRLSAGL